MITRWEDITIGKYKEIRKAIEESNKEDIMLAIVAILDDKTLDDVLNMPISELSKRIKESQFVLNYPDIDENNHKTKYMINGKSYKVIKKINQMTTNQYLDFQIYGKEPEKYLTELLSIFLIPEGKQYNYGYDLEEVKEEIDKHFNIIDGLTLSAFFLSLFKDSIMSMLYSLQAQIMIMRKTLTKEDYKKIMNQIKGMRQLISGSRKSRR